jgi:diphthine synthase
MLIEYEVLSRSSLCIAVARVGQDDQKIVATTLGELLDIDVGPPLHSVSFLT